jgi:hypothetical protein
MRLITAKFNSNCHGCGDEIAAGDEMWYGGPGGPVRCVGCGPDFAGEDRRGAATADEDVPGYVGTLQKQVSELQIKVRKLDLDLHEPIEATLVSLNRRLEALEAWAKKLSADLDVAPPEA